MATETPGIVITMIAGADLSAKQYFGVLIAADGQVDAAGTGGQDIDGVLQNAPDTAGLAAEVMTSGISKMVVGTGDIVVGMKCQIVGSTGISEAASSDHVIGKALDTGAAGEIVRVLLGSNHILA